MIDSHLINRMEENFYKAYKDLLITKVYKSKEMYKNQFNNDKTKNLYRQIVKEYFSSIQLFYQKYPNGSFEEQYNFLDMNGTLKSMVKEYVSQTNDSTFYNFLRCYGYCAEQVNYEVYDEYGDYSESKANKVIKHINESSVIMYESVKNDMKAKNYWWLYDTATSLRRQLNETLVLINSERMQKMLEKYFERPIDVHEFMSNADLVRELDILMLKNHKARPYYFWWGINSKGEKGLLMSPHPPEIGVYTFVSYQTYTQENATTKEHNL